MVPCPPGIPASAGLERDGLVVVLAAVSPEHQVGVAPGGLGGFHLERVVVVTLEEEINS